MPIRSAPAKHSPERTIRNKSALYGFWDTLCGILMLHTKTLFSLSEVSELLAFAIKQEANRLKMKYQTDDPYEICRAMKIQVMKQPITVQFAERSCSTVMVSIKSRGGSAQCVGNRLSGTKSQM